MKVHEAECDQVIQKSPTLVHQKRLIEKRRLAKFRYKRTVGCILKALCVMTEIAALRDVHPYYYCGGGRGKAGVYGGGGVG